MAKWNLLWSFLGYGSTFFLALGSSSLAARTLGPEGRGALSAILALPMLLPYLATLGMGQSTIYYTARKPAEVGRYLGTTVGFGLLSSVIVCLVMWPIQAWTLHAFDPSVRRAGLAFLLFVPLSIAFAMPSAAFQGLQRFAAFNALRAMPQVLYLIVLAVGWSRGIKEPSWIAYAYLMVCAVVSVPLAWLTYGLLVGKPLKSDVRTMKETFSYGIYSMLGNLPTTANRNIDQIFIAALLPAADLGWYAVAASWGSLLAPVMYAIGSNLFPKLASVSTIDARVHLITTLRWSAVLIIGSTIVLLALTPIVIPFIFGHSFLPAVRPALILVAAGTFLAFNIVLEDGLRGLGRPKIPMLAQSAALIVTLAGINPSLRHSGIMGAAWLSLASYATASLILIVALIVRNATEPAFRP